MSQLIQLIGWQSHSHAAAAETHVKSLEGSENYSLARVAYANLISE